MKKILFLIILLLTSFTYAENFYIQNIGVSGIQNVSDEFTSFRTVILELNITNNVTVCTFKNDNESYGIWEPCSQSKIWMLSNNVGIKTVHVQINHTNQIVTYYNDSIYYDFTGSGLDTTPPSQVTFISSNYSNNNQSITFEWEPANDSESEILGIPLIYHYQILLNGIENITWTQTNNTKLSYDLNTTQNDNITIQINTTNSANLISTSSFVVNIDLVNPSTPDITSSLNTGNWYNNKSVFFNWTGTDDKEVDGYSYTFSQDANIVPDDISDGPKTDTKNHINKTFTTNSDGIYYFKIKTIDKAKNPSNVSTYTIKIDKTPPNKPELIDYLQTVGGDLNITWDKSSDISGIQKYQVNLSTIQNFSYINRSENFTTNKGNFSNLNLATYYILVRAQNGAGNWSVWSNEEEVIYDNTAPTILFQNLDNDASVARTNPILIIKTDEDADCIYNNNNFTFTGKKYHEVRVDAATLDNITCIDKYGNLNFYTISAGAFSNTPPIVSNPNSHIFYADFYTSIDLTTNSIYGYETQDFEAKIDNEIIDFNIVPTQASDNYTLIFKTPKTPGIHTLNIGSKNITLTINKLNFTTEYYNAGALSNLQETIQTTKGTVNSNVLGLISETLDNDLNSDSNSLSLLTSSNNKRLLFFTSKTANLNKKEYEFYNNNFLNQNPTINDYSIAEKSTKIIIENSNIEINSTQNFGKGLINLKIKLLTKSNGKKIISINKQNQYENTIKVYD